MKFMPKWQGGDKGGMRLTFAITAICIADYSCAEVCPAEAISPGPDHPSFSQASQLFIAPSRCIDCAACEEACPVGAIFSAERGPPRLADAVWTCNGFVPVT